MIAFRTLKNVWALAIYREILGFSPLINKSGGPDIIMSVVINVTNLRKIGNIAIMIKTPKTLKRE